MKLVDMSHVMNVHTPGWVGYAGNKMYYAQNLQTQMIVAQRIDTALHVGTHFDGAMHATDNRKGDMASLPLDYLVNRGVVVDISHKMSDWAVITPEIIESAGADIREGDILILHTGWHKHYEGQPQQDLVKYFCYHPGPNLDTLHWMLKKKIKWWGMDTGSCDHAMNTSIRTMRPDLAAQFTKLHGKTPARVLRNVRIRPQEVRPPGRRRRVSVPQLGIPGGPAARREPRRRHRAHARQARADRRLPLALRGARRLPLPHRRLPRCRRQRRGCRQCRESDHRASPILCSLRTRDDLNSLSFVRKQNGMALIGCMRPKH